MIVIKVELWPFADESGAKEIAGAHIINDGSGSITEGNYFGTFWDNRKSPKGVKVWDTYVKDHPRDSSIWLLIYKHLIQVTDYSSTSSDISGKGHARKPLKAHSV